jgi:hypothetical protein
VPRVKKLSGYTCRSCFALWTAGSGRSTPSSARSTKYNNSRLVKSRENGDEKWGNERMKEEPWEEGEMGDLREEGEDQWEEGEEQCQEGEARRGRENSPEGGREEELT